jgi:cytochrome c oxidase subunit 4
MAGETHGTGSGGSEAAAPQGAHGAHMEPHASNRTYIAIALVLGVITALEVMVFYVEALAGVLVPILLVMSATKFVLVVGFYMHLKYDANVRGLFFGPLMIATAIIVALMALYGYFL